jgi:hypothetical protein
MDTMFRKVDAREYVVGFYSTGPKIRANDLQLHELMTKYCENPVFVIIDVRKDVIGVPVKAYAAVDTLQEDGKETKLEFSHVREKRALSYFILYYPPPIYTSFYVHFYSFMYPVLLTHFSLFCINTGGCCDRCDGE